MRFKHIGPRSASIEVFTELRILISLLIVLWLFRKSCQVEIVNRWLSRGLVGFDGAVSIKVDGY